MTKPTFEQGIVASAAWLIVAHGEDSLAVEMLSHLVGLDAVERADEHDKNILMPHITEERKRIPKCG